jgi:uncharacterized protein
MKRSLFVVATILTLSFASLAQTTSADSPATKEDIDRYLQAIHSQEMTKQMVQAMIPGMHQMMHDMYVKHQSELPPDYESKMSAMLDDMMKSMPMDEMMKAMVPVYQKHFTKGDIDSLVAFYTSPTGEKILHEMPAIMGEAMKSMSPIMTRYMETMQQRVQRETNTMIANSKKSATGSPATHN